MIKSSPWNAAPIGCRALGDGIYDPGDGGPEQPQPGPFLPPNGRWHAPRGMRVRAARMTAMHDMQADPSPVEVKSRLQDVDKRS